MQSFKGNVQNDTTYMLIDDEKSIKYWKLKKKSLINKYMFNRSNSANRKFRNLGRHDKIISI